MAEGSCGSCENLDGTYYVKQDPDDSCRWYAVVSCPYTCSIAVVVLEVVLESGDYIIRVTMGDHVWEKNYGGTKPTCCEMTNESLTHQATGGTCDSSSAACAVSATDTTDCTGGCSHCLNGLVPPAVSVTFDSLEAGDTTAYEYDCTSGPQNFTKDCPCYASVGTAPCSNSCEWSGSWSGDCESGTVTVSVGYSAPNYIVTVIAFGSVWKATLGTTKPDCRDLDVTATYDSGSGACVNGTARVQASGSAGSMWSPGSTEAIDHLCSSCGSGFPSSVSLDLSGFTNGSCGSCTSLNTTYTLTRSSRACGGHSYTLPSSICGATGLVLVWCVDWNPGSANYQKTIAKLTINFPYDTAVAVFQIGTAPADCSSYDQTKPISLGGGGTCGGTPTGRLYW